MQNWIQNSLFRKGQNLVDKAGFDLVVAELAALSPDLPVQLIHRDLHLDNLFYDEQDFTGLIDFDMAPAQYPHFRPVLLCPGPVDAGH